MGRAERIESLLRKKLGAEYVEVKDDSARHAGHAGAASGAGHFEVLVVGHCFEGESRVARHRRVYAALEEMIPAEIHALSVRAYTGDEWRRPRGPGSSAPR